MGSFSQCYIIFLKLKYLRKKQWTNFWESPANIFWSSTRLQDMSSGRLQHVFSITILRLPRHLEDVLKDEKLLRWRRLEDVLKTCLEDVLKTCLEDVLKTLWRQAKYLLGISVSNKSKCVSNKSIFNKSTFDNSKVNPKCIK